MSISEMRAEISEALSGVTGINGHTARPTSINEGDAWPQWRGCVPKAGAAEHTWNVLVVLPQADDVTADSFVDSHGDDLLDALRPVMYVDSMLPATIAVADVGTTEMYALLITGRSE